MYIMLADDERALAEILCDELTEAGHRVKVVFNGTDAMKLIQTEKFDVVFTDIKMPGASGMDVLKKTKELHPNTPVVIITAFATVSSAVDALKNGAYDYIQKPFLSDELLHIINKLEEVSLLKSEVARLKEELSEKHKISNMIARSPKMLKVFDLIKVVADSNTGVLVIGESGTGKELVAEAIHYNSPRKKHPLIKMNCAALPEQLIENELFGHEKGAYTGAINRKIGKFEAGNNGTVFIDDIDDVPLSTQVKLLRVIQEKEIQRLGSKDTVKIDIRIVAATKKDLFALVKENKFREDLFYRLNIVSIKLPSLKERREDIPILVEHFLNKYAKDKNLSLDKNDLAKLSSYSWPGNVRQLENTVERAVALAPTNSTLNISEALSFDIDVNVTPSLESFCSLKEYLRREEKKYIEQVVSIINNKEEAAKLLGITRKTLWQKLKN